MATHDEKKGQQWTTEEQIEDLKDRETFDEITALSGIEATAASRAAWLISITVSLGGFLFGTCTIVCKFSPGRVLTPGWSRL